MEKHSIFQKSDDPSSNADDFNTTLHFFNTKGTIPSDLPDNYLHNTLTTNHISDVFLEHTSLPKVDRLEVITENSSTDFSLDPVSRSNASTSWTLESSKSLTDWKHKLQIKDFAEKNAFPEWGIQWNTLIQSDKIRQYIGYRNMNVRERIYHNEYIKWKEPCKRSGATISVVENFFLRKIFFKEFLEEYEALMDELEKGNTKIENVQSTSSNDSKENSTNSQEGDDFKTEGMSTEGAASSRSISEEHRSDEPRTPKRGSIASVHQSAPKYERNWKYSFCLPKESKNVYREYMLCLFGGVDENGNSLNDCWLYDALTGFWKEIHFSPLEKKRDFELSFSSKYEYHQHHFEASENVKYSMNPNTNQKREVKPNHSLISNNIRDLSFFKKTVDDTNGNEKFNRFNKLKMSEKSLKPMARSGHAMIGISETELLIFGGKQTETFEFFNDIWILSFKFNGSIKWKMMSPRGKPPAPRWNFSMVLLNKRIYVYGGESANEVYCDDISCYDIDLNVWVQLRKPFESPCRRMLHGSCLIKDQYFIIGGYSDSPDTTDIWSYDIHAAKWKQYIFEAPSPFHDNRGNVKRLYGHQCISWEKKIVLLGGKYSQYEPQDKVWMFDTTTYMWHDITSLWQSQNPPLGRFNQALAVYRHNYVDSDLLDSDDKVQHDEFRFIVERKQMFLPNRTHPEVDIRIRKVTDVFFFGGESSNQTFDELFRLSLRLEVLV